MNFHVFLSSMDSSSVHAGNTPADFTVELAQSIQLTGRWECALVDYQLTGASIPYDPFCICSDICEASCVGDIRLPVLRRASFKGKKVESLVEPELPQYIGVKRDQMKRIRVYITDSKNRRFAVPGGELSCTVHFRKTL